MEANTNRRHTDALPQAAAIQATPDPYAELASLLVRRGFTPEDVARELYRESPVLAAPVVAAMEAAQRDGAR
jgi:hypothetical protein